MKYKSSLKSVHRLSDKLHASGSSYTRSQIDSAYCFHSNAICPSLSLFFLSYARTNLAAPTTSSDALAACVRASGSDEGVLGLRC